MKRFTFRLETLLRTKKSQEELFGFALLNAEVLRRKTARHCEELEAKRTRFGLSWEREKRPVFPIREAQTAVHYLEGVKEQLEKEELKLKQIDAEVLELRQKCAELIKERKMLENLKSRFAAAYRLRGRRQEMKRLDAMSLRGLVGPTEDCPSA